MGVKRTQNNSSLFKGRNPLPLPPLKKEGWGGFKFFRIFVSHNKNIIYVMTPSTQPAEILIAALTPYFLERGVLWLPVVILNPVTVILNLVQDLQRGKLI